MFTAIPASPAAVTDHRKALTVGSLFAGVGGFDIAAERAGMEVVWQSEYDKHASGVLEHHWPGKNLGDIHGITTTAGVDVLTGGFPCQDFSVAGTLSGLAGDRGALWWEYRRLIAEGRPTWVVGENVPGLLSSNGGRDFATIVDSLVELGYGVVWGVLDAQYFGVPQRRRRVFIVGHAGGRPRPEVLALGEGLFGHPEPRRQTREGASADAVGGAVSSSGGATVGSLTTAFGPKNYTNLQEVAAGSLVVGHQIQAELIGRNPDAGPNGRGVTDINADPAYTLNVAGGVQAVAFTQNQRDEVRDLNDVAGALAAEPGMKQQTYVAGFDEINEELNDELHHTVRAGTKQSTGAVVMRQREGKPGGGKGNDQTLFTDSTVRRLTPLECERLQGFPDGWTDIPGNSDSQRYRQMGNAVAVPVVEWIMKRIASS